jgi:iron complex outermembrane receptor protein
MPISRARTGLLLGAAALLLLSTAAWAAEPAADAAGAASTDDSEIVVSGVMPATVASAATKTDTPIVETPQSISVIDSSEIKNLGLQNLNQALRFVAGVTPETRGSSAEVYDQFKLRGFDAPVYLDGLKQFTSASGYASTQVDLSRLDRIEVLKGPSGALYGQSGPGGIVDQESKLPIDRDFYGAVSGTYGNYDLYRIDADVGGKIGDGALWRLYGSANGAHDQQTYGKRRRETVSAAVTVGAGSRTSFTVLAAYSHDPRNGDYGVFPAIGTFFANPAGKIPTSFYGGEPGDYFSREQFGLTYIFKHDFGGGWSFRSAGRYQYVKSDLGIVYTGGTPVDTSDPAPTVYARYSYATHEQLNDWTYDNQLKGSFDTGPLHHSLLLGVDRQVAHSAELYAFGGGTPIDVFDPVYGTMATPSDPYHVLNYSGVGFTTPTPVETRTRQQGIYAQDQASVGGLRLALSGRQDWARSASAGQAQRDKKFTYRVGALYMTSIGVAPYVSYSTSFEPQSITLSDGSLAKPSLGRQFETGVKYQVPGTQILITGAWFDIHQTNVAVPDSLFTYYQAGEVRSRGVEIEASAELPYGFNTKVAFSRQSVKELKDINADNVGHGLLSVGRGGITANLDWSPKSGPAEGLTIGGTVRHIDSVYAGLYTTDNVNFTPTRTPAVTLFDALIRYDLGKAMPRLEGVSLGLNATNLFDKKYLSSCMAPYSWCWYGDRRTVQGTIGFSW